METSNLPKISVVLPVYNVAPYIKEALDSILFQTVQDFEIIIIDDASTDDTLGIISSYDDPRIRILKKTKNSGLINSLNLGFREAKGEFIARMDGDDVNVKDRFEKQLKVLIDNPDIDACGCWIRTIGEGSEKTIKHKEFDGEITAWLLKSCSMSLGSAMLRRRFFEKCYFDKEKIHVEDYDLWARMAFDSKYYNVQEVLSHYRIHESQVSTKFNSIQKENDVPIKLNLFKKIPFDSFVFTDSFLVKILFSDDYITHQDLKMTFHWFKILEKNNEVYDAGELKLVLQFYKKNLIDQLFFLKNGRKGLSKKWRAKALFCLPLKEVQYVIKRKIFG